MTIEKPAIRPNNPHFSSGPCTKPPVFSLAGLSGAALGRSHRSALGKSKLREVIDKTRNILEVPDNYRIGIVPASDTGAVEMAMWSLLGERPVEVLAWESFGADWITDAVEQLDLEVKVQLADFGLLPDFDNVDFDNDVVFTWNGTTAGVKLPNGDAIPEDRKGLTICDATSAAFAMDLPWDRLDVTTFSWQKVMGGEAGHGMLILSPRAVARLESFVPPRPLPKIFRMTKGGKINEGIFEGATINTPSMLAVEDYLLGLNWADGIGGLQGLIARSMENFSVLETFCSENDWINLTARDPRTQSNTSVCMEFSDPRIHDHGAFSNGVVARLEAEGVAFDIGSYPAAPPGLRVWCGSTVESSDLQALMPWLSWAFDAEMAETR